MRDFSQIKLKYVAELFNGNSIPDELKDDYEGKAIPYIPTKELSVEDGTINYDNGLSVDEEDGFRIAPAESVLMCIEGGSAGKKIGFTDRPVAFVNKLCCIHGTSSYPKFLYHALRSKDFSDQFLLNLTGLIGGVTVSTLKNLYVTLPVKIEEQQLISEFLDKKCTQIDMLIANQEHQIEKLKSYRQSVITETVTKGLSHSTMKECDANWLCSIPETWTMMRGKGIFVEIDNRSKDGNEELLTVSQYTGITPRSQKNVNMFEAATLEGYKICEIGDIAANTMWMWAGAIGVSNYHGVISPSYNIYRQKHQHFDPFYLDYLLRIPPLVQCYESMSTGIRASRLRLYPQAFLSILFPVPPMEEQQQIVSFLRGKCEHIDQLIEIKQRKIEKLQQYKKSVIYEYVTGKREVI